jgi:hypothetical protein
MDAREAGRAAAQRLLHTDPLSKESVDMIADAVMDAFAPNHRAEVLREAAESVRRWADASEKHLLEGEHTGARMAANHIDYNP